MLANPRQCGDKGSSPYATNRHGNTGISHMAAPKLASLHRRSQITASADANFRSSAEARTETVSGCRWP